jgi:Protein of unknown function (DUF3037)
VPAPSSFDYAVVRIVPRVEREEFINAGVVLFCLGQDFLSARTEVNAARILALWPAADLDTIRDHLAAVPRICAGLPEAGPIAKLSLRERFHWLVAPRSTIIQVSPVHSGLCESPASALDHLFRQIVDLP